MTDDKNLRIKFYGYPLFLALLVDAGYLSWKYYDFYYRAGFLNSLGCSDDCDSVMMSPYALLFGFPLPFYGFVFYLLCLALYVGYHVQPSKILFRTLLDLSLILGSLVSFFLIYLLYFQVHALCKFCLGAHLTFFALSILYFSKLRGK